MSSAQPAPLRARTAPPFLCDYLERRAAERPQATVLTHLTFDGREPVRISNGLLYERALAVAGALAAAGLRGKPVLLIHPPGPEFAPAFLGALLARAIAVPAPAPRFEAQYTRLERIAADCRAGAVLAPEAVLEGIGRRLPETSPLRTCRWVRVGEGPARGPMLERPDESDIALLQYTSGSTGMPRGVAVTHGNLAHNLDMIVQAFQLPEGTTSVSWLPHFHDMGLVAGFMSPLVCGGHSILMSPLAFLQRPLRWLEAISEYGALMSGAPNFAYDLCSRWAERGNLPALDLSRWKIAFARAEPVRRSTLDAFAQRFRASGFEETALTPCYGMAEATLMVACKPAGKPPAYHPVSRAALEGGQAALGEGETAVVLTSCGRPVVRSEVRIVDPRTRAALGPRRVGEVWVAGPHIAAGYWTEAPDDPFRGALAGSGDGRFLRTGDLGFLTEAGELVFADRIKDVIVIHGQNFVCHDLEATAAAGHELLAADGCAAMSVETSAGPHLVMAAEFPREALDQAENAAQAVRAALFRVHGLAVRSIVLVPPGKLSRTTSGKLQRRRTARHLVEGSMRVLAWFGEALPRAPFFPEIAKTNDQSESHDPHPTGPAECQP